MWQSVARCGVVWCGVVALCCGVVLWCCGVVVCCGVVLCGVVWCGVVWCVVRQACALCWVWCGLLGVVWCVGCGVVWCGVVGWVWGGVVWCVCVCGVRACVEKGGVGMLNMCLVTNDDPL